jgi:hypothetical protein
MFSAWSAAAWGAAFGILNGWASRLALQWALRGTDRVFYPVYAAGLAWRLAFLAGSVWFLRDKKYIILLPFASALIFTQLIFAAIPLRKDGTENNS